MLGILILIVLISVLSDWMLYKKIKQLMLLDKRQQSYITDLLSYNTQIVILQKLFFCITLINDPQTRKIGEEKLKRNFELPQNFELNAQNLIIQFQKLLKGKDFRFIIKDGKYIIK